MLLTNILTYSQPADTTPNWTDKAENNTHVGLTKAAFINTINMQATVAYGSVRYTLLPTMTQNWPCPEASTEWMQHWSHNEEELSKPMKMFQLNECSIDQIQALLKSKEAESGCGPYANHLNH